VGGLYYVEYSISNIRGRSEIVMPLSGRKERIDIQMFPHKSQVIRKT